MNFSRQQLARFWLAVALGSQKIWKQPVLDKPHLHQDHLSVKVGTFAAAALL
jgi:hypothetical protein